MKPVENFFGISIERAHSEARCIPAPIGCGGPATAFRDLLSAKEYRISGLCQACQDKIFGTDASGHFGDVNNA